MFASAINLLCGSLSDAFKLVIFRYPSSALFHFSGITAIQGSNNRKSGKARLAVLEDEYCFRDVVHIHSHPDNK